MYVLLTQRSENRWTAGSAVETPDEAIEGITTPGNYVLVDVDEPGLSVALVGFVSVASANDTRAQVQAIEGGKDAEN